MKFTQILYLLLCCVLLVSCWETMGEQHDISPKESTIPSSKKKNTKESTPRIKVPKSDKIVPVKPVQKKKSRALDTLKPSLAIVY